MKIKIWIPIKDAVKNRLDSKNYSVSDPDSSDWVEVLITTDEFTRLEDRDNRGNDWVIDQYNRNKLVEDQVNSIDEIPFIYERNPDTNKVYRRRKGDYDNREEVKVSSERIADFSDMLTFIKSLNGGEFREWYERASDADKAMYNKVFEKLQETNKK